MAEFLTVALLIVGILLIFVILLQRGRGGGLAGAFGGLGGQSAFGTKAGDVFTKITVVLAVIWVVIAGVAGILVEKEVNSRFKSTAGDSISTPEADEETDEKTDGEKTEDNSDENKSEADVKPEEDSDKKPAEETSKEETKKEDSATDKKAEEEKPSEEKKPEETKVEEKKTEEKKTN
jgi:preprotein translocase subunit SecG